MWSAAHMLQLLPYTNSFKAALLNTTLNYSDVTNFKWKTNKQTTQLILPLAAFQEFSSNIWLVAKVVDSDSSQKVLSGKD